MLSTLKTITTYVGDTKEWPVTIAYRSGGAVDIAGHTLSWLVSATRDGAALLQVDVTSHSDPAGGVSALTLTAADLETIGGAGDYFLTGVDIDALGHEVTRAVCNLRIRGRPARS